MRFAPEPPRAPRGAAPDGWSHSADGGFVRVDLNPPAAAPGGGDPFLAFAMRGTDVPPAPRRADLPPRHQALTTTRLPQGVDARVPPC